SLGQAFDAENVREVVLERSDRLRDGVREIWSLELALDLRLLRMARVERVVFEDVRRQPVEVTDEAKRVATSVPVRASALAAEKIPHQCSHALIVGGARQDPSPERGILLHK